MISDVWTKIFGEDDLILVKESSGEVIAEELEIADSFWSRLCGLMFRRSFSEGEAIIFDLPKPRHFGIHTFFVFFSIDLVYLDSELKIVEVEEELSSWRTYKPKDRVSFLVELPGGTVARLGLDVGDCLALLEDD